MTLTNTDELYREFHMLQKLILGSERNHWLNSWAFFKYPSGVIKRWKQKLDQLLDQDLQQRPHILRNEGGWS